MLFVSSSALEVRKRVIAAVEAGTMSEEAAFLELLDADPQDAVALAGLARVRTAAGDRDSAEAYLWRAIDADPCVSKPYVDLARLYYSQGEISPFADGLAELGISRVAQESIGSEVKPDLTKLFQGKHLRQAQKLSAAEQHRLLSRILRERQQNEPPEVANRLRYIRLARQVQQDGDLDEDTVDEIIEAGGPMVPLLTGIARAWARDTLPEDEEPAMENAVALLGEIAGVSSVADLLEFVSLEDNTASGVAGWALGRLLERDPDGWTQTVIPLIPAMDFPERMSVMVNVHKRPSLPVATIVSQVLAEHMGSLANSDLDLFFPFFLMSTVAALGERGLPIARAALLRTATSLATETRRLCEQALSDVSKGDLPPSPVAPPEFSVYEICGGGAIWPGDGESEDEDGEEEEEEDDFLAPVRPIVRQLKPGRNDPCWCGNGKKYKKCHLSADEAGERPESIPSDFNSLRQRIGDFLHSRVNKTELKRATEEFLETGGESDPDIELAVSDWLAHDWIAPGFGRTVMSEFLTRYGSTLSVLERDLVDTWATSFMGLYEVQSIDRGTGIVLKDLLTGSSFFAQDVSLSKSLALWDCLFVRLVPGERGVEVTGAGILVPRHNLEEMMDWLKRDRRRKDLTWPAYMKEHWPRARRQTFELARQWRDSLRLANTDGEELLFSKAVYEVKGESPHGMQEAQAGLESSGDNKFVWLNEKKTVLGNVSLEENRLVVECNSRQRLERARTMVEQLLGGSARHVADEFKTFRELKESRKGEPLPEPEPDALPREVLREAESQMLRAHYADWPDRNLPALGDKTPRQAMKTARGRRDLEAVLKSIENGEERKKRDGLGFYDVNEIRRALGLNPGGG